MYTCTFSVTLQCDSFVLYVCGSQLVHFLGHLGDALHAAKKSLILVIPPALLAK